MDDLIMRFIKELKQIEEVDKYDALVNSLKENLSKGNYESGIIREVSNKSRYLPNKFSTESTLENMAKAKNNLLIYLESILNEHSRTVMLRQNHLKDYLDNFYSFLEVFREVAPHKKATLAPEN